MTISDEIQQQVTTLQEQGKTVNFLVQGDVIIGLIGLLDTPKPDAIHAIQ
ncbi:MAG: hypothetical protein H6766_07540 [Candidatus Peribacteria bacterium]|nr:MAG: hypothetical protein H6766_07540 [Candidatus Peribacteria bacterium]